MLAREIDAGVLAIQAQHRLIMLDDDAVLLIERRVGQTLPGFEPPHQLPQKPGPAISAPPDHNAVRTRLAKRSIGILDGTDIAIDDDGPRHGLLDDSAESPREIGSASS